MRFAVPQFIEREAKVVGPLTFKQSVILAAAGAVCFLLYFKSPVFIWLPSVFLIMGVALSLSFLKIGGRSLLAVVKNFFTFSLSPKAYIWKRRMVPKKKVKKIEKKEEEKKEPQLKVIKRSKLEEAAKKVETKSR